MRYRLLFFFFGTLLFLLKFFCRLLAALPVGVVSAICGLFGFLVRVLMPSRCRTVMGSLHHAFPEKTEAWRRRVFREATARIFEMALFLPVSSFFTSKRRKDAIEIGPEVAEIFNEYTKGGAKHGQPLVLLLPHMTMSEAATQIQERFKGAPSLSVVFRPLNQPSINEWVTKERERYGAKMLSRRSGYNDAMAALRNGEMVGLLFDQHTSGKGTTITFMDRIASATDLPGLMAHRFNADVVMLLMERKSFWKARLTVKKISLGESPTEITIQAHDVLEEYLRRDDGTASDWLWLHDRWDHFYSIGKRFRFPVKRNQLELSNRLHGYDSLPRKTQIWVRLPNWLGDVVMALPILRAIQAARPDFAFTLIGKAAFEPLVHRLAIADHFIPLPKRGNGYFKTFYRMRFEYPDTYLMFTNSFRSDLEAFLTRCQQRLGMVRPGKKRPLLSGPFLLSDTVDESQVHQTHVWEKMACFYGLDTELDFKPISKPALGSEVLRVGLICGTENAPEKRWPIVHWRALVEQLLTTRSNVEILLYGTPADRVITDQVAEGFDSARVKNLAGKTDLSEFCDGLKNCHVVSCNDTGGMHLANMLGTPVVAIFGPTNPVRTGPIFETPAAILQPEGCPKTGGATIDGILPERAVAAVQSFLGE